MNSDFKFKSNPGVVNIDEAQGIVECFVAGIGNKDSVGDIVISGAFAKSLTRRKPRVVWGHSWNDPIGKVLEMYEVPPNDSRLPAKMKAAGIGGLYARVQFNLQSDKGKEAFASVAFFGTDQEWSIGYKTIDAIFDPNLQANVLKEVELYEVSPVLHGANQLTGTISVKNHPVSSAMPTMMPMTMDQMPRIIIVSSDSIGEPEEEREEDDEQELNLFAEGLAQPLTDEQKAKIQSELSERTGSKVEITHATEGSIVFKRTTTDGKTSMYRVGYHTPDDYNTFMFGKPEIYADGKKPQAETEIQSKPNPDTPVVLADGGASYRENEQQMSSFLGSEENVNPWGKSLAMHLIQLPGYSMKDASQKLSSIFEYHKLDVVETNNGLLVTSQLSSDAMDALQVAVKGIGQTIGQSAGTLRSMSEGFNPRAIDGDNDGFAQDNTAFMRPYIPIGSIDTDLPDIGGEKRNSSELLDKPSLGSKIPAGDPSLLAGTERQTALAAGKLTPRTREDMMFLADRRPNNPGLAKYWDMNDSELTLAGQRLKSQRSSVSSNERGPIDTELYKISHEFTRRQSYEQQFGKKFTPPKGDKKKPEKLNAAGRTAEQEAQRMEKFRADADTEAIDDARALGSRSGEKPKKPNAAGRTAEQEELRNEKLRDGVNDDLITEAYERGELGSRSNPEQTAAGQKIIKDMLVSRGYGRDEAENMLDNWNENDNGTEEILKSNKNDLLASIEEHWSNALDRMNDDKESRSLGSRTADKPFTETEVRLEVAERFFNWKRGSGRNMPAKSEKDSADMLRNWEALTPEQRKSYMGDASKKGFEEGSIDNYVEALSKALGEKRMSDIFARGIQEDAKAKKQKVKAKKLQDLLDGKDVPSKYGIANELSERIGLTDEDNTPEIFSEYAAAMIENWQGLSKSQRMEAFRNADTDVDIDRTELTDSEFLGALEDAWEDHSGKKKKYDSLNERLRYEFEERAMSEENRWDDYQSRNLGSRSKPLGSRMPNEGERIMQRGNRDFLSDEFSSSEYRQAMSGLDKVRKGDGKVTPEEDAAIQKLGKLYKARNNTTTNQRNAINDVLKNVNGYASGRQERRALGSRDSDAIDEAIKKPSKPAKIREYGAEEWQDFNTSRNNDPQQTFDEPVSSDFKSHEDGAKFVGHTVTFSDGRRGVIVQGFGPEYEIEDNDEYGPSYLFDKVGSIRIAVTHDKDGNRLDEVQYEEAEFNQESDLAITSEEYPFEYYNDPELADEFSRSSVQIDDIKVSLDEVEKLQRRPSKPLGSRGARKSTDEYKDVLDFLPDPTGPTGKKYTNTSDGALKVAEDRYALIHVRREIAKEMAEANGVEWKKGISIYDVSEDDDDIDILEDLTSRIRKLNDYVTEQDKEYRQLLGLEKQVYKSDSELSDIKNSIDLALEDYEGTELDIREYSGDNAVDWFTTTPEENTKELADSLKRKLADLADHRDESNYRDLAREYSEDIAEAKTLIDKGTPEDLRKAVEVMQDAIRKQSNDYDADARNYEAEAEELLDRGYRPVDSPEKNVNFADDTWEYDDDLDIKDDGGKYSIIPDELYGEEPTDSPFASGKESVDYYMGRAKNAQYLKQQGVGPYALGSRSQANSKRSGPLGSRQTLQKIDVGDSQAIDDIHYDDMRKELHVGFTSPDGETRRYTYFGVSQDEADAIDASPSKGRAINDIKRNHDVEKIDSAALKRVTGTSDERMISPLTDSSGKYPGIGEPIDVSGSSALEDAFYDPRKRELVVKYKDGGSYVYEGVLPGEASALNSAPSKGRAINDIKKNHPVRKYEKEAGSSKLEWSEATETSLETSGRSGLDYIIEVQADGTFSAEAGKSTYSYQDGPDFETVDTADGFETMDAAKAWAAQHDFAIIERESAYDKIDRDNERSRRNQPVDVGYSSALESASWDERNNELSITYKGGKKYIYSDFTQDDLDKFEANPSKGRAANEVKKNHPVRKADSGPLGSGYEPSGGFRSQDPAYASDDDVMGDPYYDEIYEEVLLEVTSDEYLEDFLKINQDGYSPFTDEELTKLYKEEKWQEIAEGMREQIIEAFGARIENRAIDLTEQRRQSRYDRSDRLGSRSGPLGSRGDLRSEPPLSPPDDEVSDDYMQDAVNEHVFSGEVDMDDLKKYNRKKIVSDEELQKLYDDYQSDDESISDEAADTIEKTFYNEIVDDRYDIMRESYLSRFDYRDDDYDGRGTLGSRSNTNTLSLDPTPKEELQSFENYLDSEYGEYFMDYTQMDDEELKKELMQNYRMSRSEANALVKQIRKDEDRYDDLYMAADNDDDGGALGSNSRMSVRDYKEMASYDDLTDSQQSDLYQRISDYLNDRGEWARVKNEMEDGGFDYDEFLSDNPEMHPHAEVTLTRNEEDEVRKLMMMRVRGQDGRDEVDSMVDHWVDQAQGNPDDMVDLLEKNKGNLRSAINEAYDIELERQLDARESRELGSRSSGNIDDVDVSESSALDSAYYHAPTGELVVSYAGGRSYVYEGVSNEEFQNFNDSPSKGRAINEIKRTHGFRVASDEDRNDRIAGDRSEGDAMSRGALESNWKRIGSAEQQRYLSRETNSAISSGSGQSTDELLNAAQMRAMDDRNMADLEMQAESVGSGGRSIDVSSSQALNRVTYDKENELLSVEYRGRDGKGAGTVYEYQGVPEDVVASLESSDSRGAALRQIRDDYEFTTRDALPDSAYDKTSSKPLGSSSKKLTADDIDDATVNTLNDWVTKKEIYDATYGEASEEELDSYAQGFVDGGSYATDEDIDRFYEDHEFTDRDYADFINGLPDDERKKLDEDIRIERKRELDNAARRERANKPLGSGSFDDASVSPELQDLQSRIQTNLVNPGSRNGKRNKPIDKDVAANLANPESDAGTLVYPSTQNEGDYIRVSYNPEKRTYLVERVQTTRGFNRDEPPEETVMSNRTVDNSYDAGSRVVEFAQDYIDDLASYENNDGRAATYESSFGRGGDAELGSRSAPISYDLTYDDLGDFISIGEMTQKDIDKMATDAFVDEFGEEPESLSEAYGFWKNRAEELRAKRGDELMTELSDLRKQARSLGMGERQLGAYNLDGIAFLTIEESIDNPLESDSQALSDAEDAIKGFKETIQELSDNDESGPLGSGGSWPTPSGYEPDEFNMNETMSQIGRGNIAAISGGRVVKRGNEMVLPVNRNQQVVVGYNGGSDTYYVRAEQIITSGKDKGKHKILAQWGEVYAENVGETAYNASLKPSMHSEENADFWKTSDLIPKNTLVDSQTGEKISNARPLGSRGSGRGAITGSNSRASIPNGDDSLYDEANGPRNTIRRRGNYSPPNQRLLARQDRADEIELLAQKNIARMDILRKTNPKRFREMLKRENVDRRDWRELAYRDATNAIDQLARYQERRASGNGVRRPPGGNLPKVDPSPRGDGLSPFANLKDGDIVTLDNGVFKVNGTEELRGALGSRAFNYGPETEAKTKAEAMKVLTDQLIKSIESAETGEWKMPWRVTTLPINPTTGRMYSGSNFLMLSVIGEARGYSSPQWAGYDQWAQKGGQVRKGAKGVPVFIPIPFKGKLDPVTNEEDGGGMSWKMIRVFNRDEIDGLPEDFANPPVLPEGTRIDNLEKTLSQIAPKITNGGSRAFYRPSDDSITVPEFKNFKSARDYYGTVAHEIMHWTGHKSRLNRDHMGQFGTPEYAYEELVAEIASAMFVGAHGLEPNIQENHGPYLKHWLKKLKDDPTALQRAIKDAQAAFDYVNGASPNLRGLMGSEDNGGLETSGKTVGKLSKPLGSMTSRPGIGLTANDVRDIDSDQLDSIMNHFGPQNVYNARPGEITQEDYEDIAKFLNNLTAEEVMGFRNRNRGTSKPLGSRSSSGVTDGKPKSARAKLEDVPVPPIAREYDENRTSSDAYEDTEMEIGSYLESLSNAMKEIVGDDEFEKTFKPRVDSIINDMEDERSEYAGPPEWALNRAWKLHKEMVSQSRMREPLGSSSGNGPLGSRMNLSQSEKNEIIAMARQMRKSNFAKSVVAQYDTNGGQLSDGQWAALNRMTLRGGGRNAMGSRSEPKKPRTPKGGWAPEDRQRFADRDILKSRKVPGKRRPGPSASEYGALGSRGTSAFVNGRTVDMEPRQDTKPLQIGLNDIIFESDGKGKSWALDDLARSSSEFRNITPQELMARYGISERAALAMKKPGAKIRDPYLADELTNAFGFTPSEIWGPNNPTAYQNADGSLVDLSDLFERPDKDFDPELDGSLPVVELPDADATLEGISSADEARKVRKRVGGSRSGKLSSGYDAQVLLNEIGYNGSRSRRALEQAFPEISEKRWRAIAGKDSTTGLTVGEVNSILKRLKSNKTGTDIFGESFESGTQTPIASIFRNPLIVANIEKRGGMNAVAEAYKKATGRSISRAQSYRLRDSKDSITSTELRMMLNELGISMEEFDARNKG